MTGRAVAVSQFLQSPSCHSLALATAVLERFVARAPRACSVAQMLRDTDFTPKHVSAICAALCKLQLISPVNNGTAWILRRHPGDITLQEAWEAALIVDAGLRGRGSAEAETASGREIDLLMQQAALSISQIVAAQLRKFQLDRVNTSRWGLLGIV